MPTLPPPDAATLMVHTQPPPPEVLEAIAKLHAACQAWPLKHYAAPTPDESGLSFLTLPDQASAMCAGPYDAAVIGAVLGGGLALMFAVAVSLCRQAIHAKPRSRAADLFFFVAAGVTGACVAVPAILAGRVFEAPLRHEAAATLVCALGAAGWRWLHWRLLRRPGLAA